MAQSAEEVRAEHLRVLGTEFGQVYHALYNEVCWLYMKWHEYRELYATSPERLELLNNAGPFFFRVVHDVLWDDVLLHLARLTDPPRSSNKSNMTMRRLASVVSDPELALEIERLVGEAERLCEFARDTRHRHLAHRDFELAVNCVGVRPLPPASRRDVGAAMAALAAVLNLIKAHYFGSTTAFAHFNAAGGADDLVCRLAVAARAEARRAERLRRGEILPEDLETPPAC
jgi:hypothetical protein